MDERKLIEKGWQHPYKQNTGLNGIYTFVILILSLYLILKRIWLNENRTLYQDFNINRIVCYYNPQKLYNNIISKKDR